MARHHWLITRTTAIVVMFMCLFGHATAAEEPATASEGTTATLQAALDQHCVDCHSGEEPEGGVNLQGIADQTGFLSDPTRIHDILRAVDNGSMPPDDNSDLTLEQRDAIVTTLRDVLRSSVEGQGARPRTPLRRMNRFQYSNAVKDLFELKVAVFSLPERMLRPHKNYFQPQTGKMPESLNAGSRPLGKSQLIEPRLAGVNPFPQDLRAEHGFDNRGDHLSISPLLLETFLKISRSIVDSPDFHAKTCGIWAEFFAPPADDANPDRDAADIGPIVRERLRRFLTRAFRRSVEEDLLDRYTAHVVSRIEAGTSFTASMKDAAAATLASPRFLYLYDESETTRDGENNNKLQPIDDDALASRLSFFLWGSIPDQPLLNLAAQRKLHEPKILREQVTRMLRDRRVKRFCDSFPAQWLQLERIISATPDPQRYPQFYFKKYRASLHMMMEPLLLFETVLIENHSINQFIDADFSYQSDLLQAWYRDGTQGNPGEDAVTVRLQRVPITDRRQGGVITNAAVMTMTSGATQTKPITRGAWLATVILNDPPEPPPADVPLLPEKPTAGEASLTIRERFAVHREQAACASCHRSIDPLGFALENYDAAGIWRDKYDNGRTVDVSGKLYSRHDFSNIVEFKDALLQDQDRFPRALAAHLLSYALGREVTATDAPALDKIVCVAADDDYRLHTLIQQIVLSEPFQR